MASHVERTIAQFNEQSLELRLKLAFEGMLFGPDRDNFLKLVHGYKEKMETILTKQENAKKIIEEYEGDDWDNRYGTTNLWRKIGFDINNTQLHKARLNSYFSQIADNKIKEKLPDNDPKELLHIADEFVKKDYSKEPEKVLELAGLLRKHPLAEAMEKLFDHYPAVANLAGQFIAEELKQTRDLQNYSLYEIELAVKNLPQTEVEKNAQLLERIAAVEKFQTPIVLYTAALSAAEPNPQLSLDHLLQTAELLKHSPQKNETLTIEMVLTHAANIAYSSFKKERIDCQTASRVFEKYLQTVPQPEDRLIYLTAIVHQKCGNIAKAISLLDSLAKKADSKFKRGAVFSLVELGKTEGSIPAFISAVANDCNTAPFATDLLKESLEIIEKLAESENFAKTLNDLTQLAKITYDCSDGSQKETALAFYMELMALTGIDQPQFAGLKNMIETSNRDNPFVLRAIARMEQAEGYFEKAAYFWSSLAAGFKEKDSPEAKNWYWRAKYYELYNYEKIGADARDKARHSLDILLSGQDLDIDPFWAAKFEQLSADLSNVR
ncbi:MAG: hypothetical protein PHF37_06720 [Phycisphaerae bacterium]|nr:hypothetical protein [Phycisphaerae bacterium]